jgi:hypothetical protein
MELIDYRNQMFQDIQVSARANIADISSEFINYVTNILIDAEEIEDFTECYFESIGKRNKRIQIDGYNIDEVDYSCCIFISDFTNDENINTLTNTEIDRLFEKMRAYIDNAISGYIREYCEESSAGYEFALQVEEEIESITKFRFFILTDKVISKRVKSVKKEDVFNRHVELNVWDITRLRDIEQSKTGKEEIEINFEEYGVDGLPCLRAMTSEVEQYNAFLMAISGGILAEIYLEYGARLLEGNVRSFLSNKSKVNKGIRNTILTKPEMFFAYNNGIAATASFIESKETERGLIITKIKNLQIINGGQTTASIANSVLRKEGDVTKVFVPMKLSIVEGEKAEEIIPLISRCANSQNKIDEADFASNHPFHIRMEEFSRKVLAPAVDGNQYQTGWFYERARGQYSQAQMKLSASEKKTFALKWNKKQIIRKVDLAKYLNSYNEYPHIVSKGAQACASFFHGNIVKEWDKSDDKFNQLYFKRAVALAILFRTVETIVSDQEWYKAIKSYRANIVTYSMAVLFNEIHKAGEKDLDYKKIWNEQKVYNELKQQIVITSKEVFDFITDEERPTLNVTQWCKQEACWSRAKNLSWTILPEFVNTLVFKTDLVEEEQDAKEIQKVSNEVKDEMEVIEKGQVYWHKLLQWSEDRKLLSSIDKDFLKLAINIERTGKIPSTKQAKRILLIRDKILLEGYQE